MALSASAMNNFQRSAKARKAYSPSSTTIHGKTAAEKAKTSRDIKLASSGLEGESKKTDTYIPSIHNPHRLKPLVPSAGDIIIGCFIDIGFRNTAARFSYYQPELDKITGMHTRKFDFDMSYGDKTRKAAYDARPAVGKNNDIYAQFTHAFMDMEELLTGCHYIVIEQQIGTCTGNVEAANYAMGVLSVILCDKGNRPLIVLLDSRVKTQMLGKPNGVEDVKEWCVDAAVEILRRNIGEHDSKLAVALPSYPKTGINKRYDVADVVCYCEVWWRKYVKKGRVLTPIPRHEYDNISLIDS